MSEKSLSSYDVVVIGGGINGCSIAADAAGRGLRVALFEQYDLASGTSSYSSKLIHGGIRYLEQYDFGLVRRALKEREVWLRRAPHLIKPLKLVLPHQKHLRPKWLIRMGLWIYDHLSSRQTLAKSTAIKRSDSQLLNPLTKHIQSGFSYYDCFCNDARLVIEIAKQARQHGADIFTQHRLISAKRDLGSKQWRLTAQDRLHSKTVELKAKVVINATGPWMGYVSQSVIQPPQPYQCQLVKGSHIIVPRLYDGDQAYILQNTDQRIVFVIPYLSEFSLIGTTDVIIDSTPEKARISNDEINYLLAIVNQYFNKTISKGDIVSDYCGVRPLINQLNKKASKVSRDYQVVIDQSEEGAPLLTITGGKLTTARLLAEETVNKLTPYFSNMKSAWTADSPLPGGLIPTRHLDRFIQTVLSEHPNLDPDLISRYCELYGAVASELLADIECMADLGQHFGEDCYQHEVDYLCRHEWARSADDIIWRRTKLGLKLSEQQIQTLQQYVEKTHVAPATR